MWVGLEDMQGKDLYINQGGLELYQVPSGSGFRADPARRTLRKPRAERDCSASRIGAPGGTDARRQMTPIAGSAVPAVSPGLA
jgi:hypothetical protein